jgi:oligopeptide/dipeptide ABC transporter ATP-binding protein
VSHTKENLIKVKNLKKHFSSGLFHKTCVKAVDGVSFCIPRGKTLGMVGESGSGKSTVGRCILRLIKPTCGEVYFQGRDILTTKGDNRSLRKQMQIIFQDADGSMNPRIKVIDQLLEPLRVHKQLNGQTKETAAELMKLVNLSADLMDRYPHELSGGQRQRIGIARAISINPKFIVADEAAASLDLLVQAQMMELLKRLQSERGISYLYISHNLPIIQRMADTVAVMYLGRFVETGKTKDIFNSPAHPYTQALLSAAPSINPLAQPKKIILKGEIPSPLQPPCGCSFHPRCPQARTLCSQIIPEKKQIGRNHWAWCHFVSPKRAVV